MLLIMIQIWNLPWWKNTENVLKKTRNPMKPRWISPIQAENTRESVNCSNKIQWNQMKKKQKHWNQCKRWKCSCLMNDKMRNAKVKNFVGCWGNFHNSYWKGQEYMYVRCCNYDCVVEAFWGAATWSKTHFVQCQLVQNHEVLQPLSQIVQ